MDEQQISDQVRNAISALAQDTAFKHHKWYVKYHLLIVEDISLALCKIHPEADQNLVSLLVWMHDYGKITNQSSTASLINGERFLLDRGVNPDRTKQIINHIKVIDRKDIQELTAAAIEIQIISSADGAAHMVGPFFSIYWWENSDLSIAELQSRNRRKLKTDWERKIVLPEVKRAFASKYHDLLANFGDETQQPFEPFSVD